MRNAKGFTLVELMIVIAIMGILAAIAVPSYIGAQLKAKRAELPANVHGVKISQLSYEAIYDDFLDCGPAPRDRASMDKEQVPWDNRGDDNWRDLGWTPDGPVRGVYETNNDPDPAIGFIVIGTADVDDDDNESRYETSRNSAVYMTSVEDRY
jgi:prepilin-type N-terminal cleavage/methylation domain-containing protein